MTSGGWADAVMDLLCPPRCAACRAFGPGHWCTTCQPLIIWNNNPVCLRCGAPGGIPCEACLTRPPAGAMRRSACLYAGPVRQAIVQMKYAKRDRCAVALGEAMAEAWVWPSLIPLHDAELVIPMPTGRWRSFSRGFNQAEVIAEAFCKRVGLSLELGLLRRRSFGSSQTRFGAWQRMSNIQGVFSVRKPELVRGRKLLLIDDVWTTGATLNEATEVLMSHGAECVFSYTAAYDVNALSRTAVQGW